MSVGALLVAALLILINGFFVAVEFAFTASRKQTIRERAEGGSRLAQMALASMNELPVTFAGAQLGVAGASLALGFVIEPALGGLFEGLFDLLGLPSGVSISIGVFLALIITAFFHNVIGEMAPKNATITAPERAALIVAAPFRFYVTILRPIILALTWMAVGVLRLLRIKPRQSIESTHSAADIAALVKTVGADGVIADDSSRLLTAAIAFRDASVAEVMAPRPDLVSLPTTSSPAELERTIVATGHSRIPVYGDSLDDIRGFVHAKDLFTVPVEFHDQPLEDRLIRTVPLVPESMSIAPVMEMMRSSRTHIAIAIDEHGSTAGLVTLEDIAEELVGEIRDEHDIREVMEIRPAGRNRYLVAGQTRIEKLSNIEVKVPDGEYETVGGFVMHRLGRIPKRGDRVENASFDVVVRRMDGRRVREVELTVFHTDTEDLDE
jgi:CBS domain containing-hemolysin-like protein